MYLALLLFPLVARFALELPLVHIPLLGWASIREFGVLTQLSQVPHLAVFLSMLLLTYVSVLLMSKQIGKHENISVVFWVLSTPLLYTAYSDPIIVLCTFCFALSLYANKIFGIILLSFSTWLSPSTTLGFLLLYAIHARLFRKDYTLVSLIVAVLCVMYGFIEFRYEYLGVFSYVLTEFGVFPGLALLYVMLALVGIAITWSKQYRSAYFIGLFLLCGAFYFPTWIYPATLLISLCAGYVVIRIVQYQWSESVLRYFSVFIIVIGVLYVGILSIVQVGLLSQTIDFVHEPGIVLADESYAYGLIKAGQTPLITPLDTNTNITQINGITQLTQELLDSNVSYIYTKDLDASEEFLNLLNNNKTFLQRNDYVYEFLLTYDLGAIVVKSQE